MQCSSFCLVVLLLTLYFYEITARQTAKGVVVKPKRATRRNSVVADDSADGDDGDSDGDRDTNEGGKEEDEDDEEEEEEEEDVGDDDEDQGMDDDESAAASGRGRSLNARVRKSKKKKSSVLSSGLESATGLMNMALKLTKGSVKAAVDLCANKHVSPMLIVGRWRLQQEIEVRKGVFVACPATIDLLDDGSVITTCDGQEYKSEYIFKERAWPRKCTISFQARAFQGNKDKEPVAMFYKGYFKRSIMNPSVVLIRGKVYRLSGKMFFKRQERCGRFKATKKRYSR